MCRGVSVYSRRRQHGKATFLKTIFQLAIYTIAIIGFAVFSLFNAWGGLSNEIQSFILIIGILGVTLLGLSIWLVIMWLLHKQQEEESREKSIRLQNVDNMDGWQFEHYVAKLFEHQGYKASVTPGSGDMGIDIVAEKEGIKYGVQVKRYATPVSRRAISDAVGALRHYGCNKAMVVTNNKFTQDAETLAKSNNCQLIDRQELADWIRSYQASALPKEIIENDWNKYKGKLRKAIGFYCVLTVTLLGGHFLWFWIPSLIGASQNGGKTEVKVLEPQPSPIPTPIVRKRSRSK